MPEINDWIRFVDSDDQPQSAYLLVLKVDNRGLNACTVGRARCRAWRYPFAALNAKGLRIDILRKATDAELAMAADLPLIIE